MRKSAFVFLACFLATSLGCEIISWDESLDGPASGSVDWLVNGTRRVVDSESGHVGWVNGPEDFETFHIFTVHEGNTGLGLHLFGDVVVRTVPATFSLGGGQAFGDYEVTNYPDVSHYRTYDPPSGTLTITRLDEHHCEGTFSFRARSLSSGASVDITDGHFNLHR